MGIRTCACENAAFGALRQAYRARSEAIEALAASGRRLVATLGCDVPEELLLAAGMQPVPLFAEGGVPLPEADRYLEYAFDPMVRAKFDRLLSGGFPWAERLVISNSTDVLLRLYLYLRELRRVEPERGLPELTFLDWLFTRNRVHQARNQLLLARFREEVGRWAGRELKREEIEAAAAVCNADKAALRRIDALRREGRITGSEALVVIGSRFFLPLETHTRLVNAVADAAAAWPQAEGLRVFYTGSVQEDTALYDLVEAQGAVVVGEDHDWGARLYDRDYDLRLPPDRAIVDEYMLREFSSKKAFVSQRVAALCRETEAAGAEAVLFYTNRYEEAASWDYPEQKKALEAKGIATASFAQCAWPCSEEPELAGRLAAALSRMAAERRKEGSA